MLAMMSSADVCYYSIICEPAPQIVSVRGHKSDLLLSLLIRFEI